MASKPTAVFFLLNLALFAFVSANAIVNIGNNNCKLVSACVNVLNIVQVNVNNVHEQCCPLLGVANADIAVCLCNDITSLVEGLLGGLLKGLPLDNLLGGLLGGGLLGGLVGGGPGGGLVGGLVVGGGGLGGGLVGGLVGGGGIGGGLVGGGGLGGDLLGGGLLDGVLGLVGEVLNLGGLTSFNKNRTELVINQCRDWTILPQYKRSFGSFICARR